MSQKSILHGSLGCVVFAVPCAIYATMMLHHFYVQGAYFLDTGLQAALIWHDSARLEIPAIIGGGSFYAFHMSPFFAFLDALSWLTPLSIAQFYAVVAGTAHALPGLVVFLALIRRQPGGGTAGRAILAALLGIAFAFNGIALAIVLFPHLEIMFVAAAILFLSAFCAARYRMATLWFVVCLMLREDGGFHLFALLAVLLVVDALTRPTPMKLLAPPLAPTIGFAAAALLWSALALALQHVLFPNHSSFLRVYVGSPPFADLSISVVLQRVLGCFVYRPYVILPAIAAALGAAVLRAPYLVFGYVAFLPWFLLQVIAKSSVAATLSGYYAFPFMIAAFCPLLGEFRPPRALGSYETEHDPRIVWLFALMIVLSWTALGREWNPGSMNLIESLSLPSLETQQRTDHAIAALVACRTSLGELAVDNAVRSLAPRSFAARDKLLAYSGQTIDTVIYFAHGFDLPNAQRIIFVGRLPHHYAIDGTALRIDTNRLLPGPCRLGGLLSATP